MSQEQWVLPGQWITYNRRDKTISHISNHMIWSHDKSRVIRQEIEKEKKMGGVHVTSLNYFSLILLKLSHASYPDSNLLSRTSHNDSRSQVTMTLTYDSCRLTLTHYESGTILSFVDSLTVLGFMDQWTLFSNTISMASPGHYSPRLDFLYPTVQRANNSHSPFHPLPVLVSPLKHSL